MPKATGTSRIMVQGNSWTVPVTKIVKKLGLNPGDQVIVTVSTLTEDYQSPTKQIDNFNPQSIGEIAKKAAKAYNYTDEELRQYIPKFDSDPEHIESVVRYVRDSD